MNFVSGDNASRQLDFKEGEAEQYPGFVRRASSGYQKYYPPEQQIQLYKPKPAPFYGQTTAGDSYKKWELWLSMATVAHVPSKCQICNKKSMTVYPGACTGSC